MVHEYKEALEILESDLENMNGSFRAEQSTDTIVHNIGAEDKRVRTSLELLSIVFVDLPLI